MRWLLMLISGLVMAQTEPRFLLHEVGRDLSEGVSVFDVNRDGRLDVVSGAFWYEAPHWGPHRFREVGFTNEYVINCGEFAVDVNGDGYEDLLSAGWQEDGIFLLRESAGDGHDVGEAEDCGLEGYGRVGDGRCGWGRHSRLAGIELQPPAFFLDPDFEGGPV
jgi:hypothetical protein